MSDVLVKADGISKKFCRNFHRSVAYCALDIGTHLLGKPTNDTLRNGEFWAVKDVSFELRRGECLGILGRNGAGKSTLLKMVNGLVVPDSGALTVRGRVAALIELGAGFNPLLTGRENIWINGAIMGMKAWEIAKTLDSIIDLSEVGHAIDSPVQTYSSGMRVKLSFSIAMHTQPDLLILDEVLAVGDAAYRARCHDRLRAQLTQGTAICFVSHNENDIQQVCSHALVLANGVTRFHGHGAAGLAYYNQNK